MKLKYEAHKRIYPIYPKIRLVIFRVSGTDLKSNLVNILEPQAGIDKHGSLIAKEGQKAFPLPLPKTSGGKNCVTLGKLLSLWLSFLTKKIKRDNLGFMDQ